MFHGLVTFSWLKVIMSRNVKFLMKIFVVGIVGSVVRTPFVLSTVGTHDDSLRQYNGTIWVGNKRVSCKYCNREKSSGTVEGRQLKGRREWLISLFLKVFKGPDGWMLRRGHGWDGTYNDTYCMSTKVDIIRLISGGFLQVQDWTSWTLIQHNIRIVSSWFPRLP